MTPPARARPAARRAAHRGRRSLAGPQVSRRSLRVREVLSCRGRLLIGAGAREIRVGPQRSRLKLDLIKTTSSSKALSVSRIWRNAATAWSAGPALSFRASRRCRQLWHCRTPWRANPLRVGLQSSRQDACSAQPTEDEPGPTGPGIMRSDEEFDFPLPGDRHASAARALPDLSTHRCVPTRSSQCRSDRALPLSTSRSTRRLIPTTDLSTLRNTRIRRESRV